MKTARQRRHGKQLTAADFDRAAQRADLDGLLALGPTTQRRSEAAFIASALALCAALILALGGVAWCYGTKMYVRSMCDSRTEVCR